MGYVRSFLASGFIALAGAGGGVIALNLHTASPRIMAVAIASAVVGILGGGLVLAWMAQGQR
jgi:uncharacterized membrane protein YjjB (DUF3815 family)